ncbi:motility associated factor glycosyltransferase family protein [Rubeoparvulum massiliense]|uniref:motility associated factor glycosyltransferase family protein n=1 Tax=Rubeoparvulum massiliense TaxID=1631346 RepID=UPI00065DD03C|nr:6-hydroxymethylpterin diphosphokinase MptE-like protein [Rubeoparvulum massiliense]
MTIYEKNMSFFKDKAPQLYDTLSKETPLYHIYLKEMPDQDNCVIETKEAKCFLHSIYDMEHEIKMMLNQTDNDIDTIILFGIGNGHLLEYILKKYNKLHEVIIVEPSQQLFKRYLERHDISKLLKKDVSLTFIVNKKENFVADALYFYMLDSKKVSIVFHVSYCSLFNSYYNNLTSHLTKLLKVKTGDIRTFAGQWQLWLLNSIKNLKTQNTLPIESIIDIFRDKTVVLVSAGPSLNKNIHLLEKIKEKAIIFAVGSAIKVLDSHGIVPHFRVAIDANPAEYRVFEDINTVVSPLIFANPLYYEILPEYEGAKIRFILESEYLGKYIYQKAKIPYKEFLSGASVANATLNFLCDIGCKRIILMGQDLSYTEEGLHAKGVSSELEDKEWAKKHEYTLMNNIYGEKVYAIDPYLQMKYTIEATVKRYPNVEFLNATEGGLGIEGVANLTAQEVLDVRLKNESNIQFEDEITLCMDTKDIKHEYYEKLSQGLDIMKVELLEVIKLQDEMILSIKRLTKLKQKKVSTNRIENEIRYLESIENRLEEIAAYRDVIVHALQADLLSIKTRFSYKGSNLDKQNEAKEIIIVNTLAKTREFVNLAFRLIEGDYNSIKIK